MGNSKIVRGTRTIVESTYGSPSGKEKVFPMFSFLKKGRIIGEITLKPSQLVLGAGLIGAAILALLK